MCVRDSANVRRPVQGRPRAPAEFGPHPEAVLPDYIRVRALEV